MRKVLAVILAILMALSCCAVAFAVEETTKPASERENKCGICGATYDNATDLNNHIKEMHKQGEGNKCPYCSRTFSDEAEYNNHITICADQLRQGREDTNYSAIIDRLISLFETTAGTSWWESIKELIIRVVDLVENTAGSLVALKAEAE